MNRFWGLPVFVAFVVAALHGSALGQTSGGQMLAFGLPKVPKAPVNLPAKSPAQAAPASATATPATAEPAATTAPAAEPAAAVAPAAATQTIGGPSKEAFAEAGKKPPSFADTPLAFQVFPERKMVNGTYKWVGWIPIIKGRVIGHTRPGDAVMVDLMQGGKALKSLRAGLKGVPAGDWSEDWEIRPNDDDTLTATGEMVARIKYVNDEGATLWTVDRKFDPVKMVVYDESQNHWTYGCRYNDLQGFSYLMMQLVDTTNTPTPVSLYTWVSRKESSLKDLNYRIEVNGQRIETPQGFDANQNHESVRSLEQEERFYVKANSDVVGNWNNYHLIAFRPYLFWGKKSNQQDNFIYMVDHPGQWVVKILSEGKLIREFRFTVDKQGVVLSHPEQDSTKPGFLNLGLGRVFVETRFPNPNDFDERFNPDAIRKGTMFGRPWTTDSVRGMLDALPPKKDGKMPFPQPTLPPPAAK